VCWCLRWCGGAWFVPVLGCPLSSTCRTCFDQPIQCAAEQGNVYMLKLLLRVAVPTSNTTITQAARSGRIEAVELLLAHGCYHPQYSFPARNTTQHSTQHSTKHARANLLRRERRPRHTWGSDEPISSAISSGKLAIVQLLQQHGATLQGRHMVTALSRGERTDLMTSSFCYTVYITMFSVY
jgi:ankyrin repeat protein